MYSKQPSEARVQVSNLLNCAIMCDVDFSFYDADELALLASDLLDQFRKRGMPDSVQHQTNNLEKLKGLVARFDAAIQTHDAEVAAAQAALSAHDAA